MLSNFLTNLSRDFNNLDKKILFEVFILILILFIALNIFLINNKKENNQSFRNTINKPVKEDIHSIYNKIKNIKDINIVSTKLNKTQIHLSIVSNLKYLNFVINSIENINEYIKVDEIKIKKVDNKFKMSLIVKTKSYSKREEMFLVNYKFKERNFIPKTSIVENENLQLNAIVFDSVILNKTNLKLNDYYDDYELIEINRKSIKLLKNKETLEVYLNE